MHAMPERNKNDLQPFQSDSYKILFAYAQSQVH